MLPITWQMRTLRLACLTALLTAATAFAQSAADENVVRAVAPLADADLARHGIVLSEKEGDPKTSLFEWRRTKLPLQVPRDRVAVGLVDSDLVVLLAGGVRHPLVVYFVDASGAIARDEDGSPRRDARAEDVAEHRERQLRPKLVGNIQAPLARRAAERDDDLRHRVRTLVVENARLAEQARAVPLPA